jgi:hypothetical protein
MPVRIPPLFQLLIVFLDTGLAIVDERTKQPISN